MKIKRRKKLDLGESAALSDLAFMLIIYFIVIAGFNVNKGMLIDLPAKNSEKIVAKNDLLRYEMDDGGRILFEGEYVERRAVERNIRNGIGQHPNLAVVLTISPNAPWQPVVSFVELAENLKVDSFSFKMKTGEED
ncbi:hypothetical protein AGMMS50212_01430 [Spirochaetia bacterium]|nr:hypothetical protein AGMMS50212_01430 [Spirochaetia bacterium]